MEKLTKQIEETTQALFIEGYRHAASSFATLTGKKIGIGAMQTTFVSPEQLIKKADTTQKITVLITEVVGAAKGSSYLLLDQYEVDQLIKLLLIKLKGFENLANFQDTILKELDNILAASVITQLANFLDLSIYGDVPSIAKPEECTQQWLKQESSKYQNRTVILSSACFTFEDDIRLQPSFIWILDDHFYRVLLQKSEVNANSNLS